jgi:serine/threonine protein kinase
MRRFLESNRRFRWPEDERKDGQMYHFTEDFPPKNFLEWERRLAIIRKTSTAIIEQHHIVIEKQEMIGFSEAFAVKELVTPVLDEKEANNEVQAMTDLLHPHVAALLGTYLYRNRLHILTFPAGCCDLGDLMHCISKNLLQETYTPPEPRQEGRNVEIHRRYTWPFRKELNEQLQMLRRYFLCLCTAVAYLHRSNLRHKDIKPENIIIDFDGNVVIMDFGISTKFEPAASKATRDPRTPSTSRYRPPEMERGWTRDDRSDVWSLGCVFLEMISLLLGKDIEECKNHCRQRCDNGAVIDDYCLNMPKIETWLRILKDVDRAPSQNDAELKATLPIIRKMLGETKEERPPAENLWRDFDFESLANSKCRDCHPNLDERWKLNDDQREKAKIGSSLRQRMTEEERRAIEKTRQRQDVYASFEQVIKEARGNLQNGLLPTRSRSPPIRDSILVSESSRRSSFHGTGTKPSPSRKRLPPPGPEVQLPDHARTKSSQSAVLRLRFPSPSPSEGSRPRSSASDKEKRSDTATKVRFSQPLESTVERDYTDISFPVPSPPAPATDAEPNPPELSGILPVTQQADTKHLATIHEPHHDSVRDVEKANDMPRYVVDPLQHAPGSKIEPSHHITVSQPKPQVASEAAQTHRASDPSSPVTSGPDAGLSRDATSRGPTTEERVTVEIVSASPGNLSNIQNQSGYWSGPADNESILACDCSSGLKLLQGHFGLLSKLLMLNNKDAADGLQVLHSCVFGYLKGGTSAYLPTVSS